MTTDGGDAEFDPLIHVRTRCDDPLTELEPPESYGCNDNIGDWDGNGECDAAGDGCRQAAELQINGEAAQTYYITVDHALAGGASNYRLSLLPDVCPSAPAPWSVRLTPIVKVSRRVGTVYISIRTAENAACGADAVVELAGAGRYQGNTLGAAFGLDASCAETNDRPGLYIKSALTETRPCA